MKQSQPIALVVALLCTVPTGCTPERRSTPYLTADQAASRDSVEAQKLNAEGLQFLETGDLNAAEARFREAVHADLYYVSAHNNLGIVLLRQEDYYEAAWEFHSAAKLAPHAAEPRANLGLLYESLGRLDDAVEEYESTLDLDPANVEAMRHLARTYVKIGRKDDRLKELLDRLLTVPDGGQWDYWARGQLIRLGRSDGDRAGNAD